MLEDIDKKIDKYSFCKHTRQYVLKMILWIFHQDNIFEFAKIKKARQTIVYQTFNSVGVRGFEPPTPRPPDAYSKPS